MQFKFKKPQTNIIDLIRSCGYSYRGNSNGPPASAQGRRLGRRGEMNFIRRVGLDEYPHYHIYVKQEKDEIVINLHLDQKKPSYQGASAHSGEYEGEVVAKEMERIKQFISD